MKAWTRMLFLKEERKNWKWFASVKENDNYWIDISKKGILGIDVSSLGNLVNFAVSGEESYFMG